MKRVFLSAQYYLLILSFFLNPFLLNLYASEVHVSSISALQSAINSSSPGDVIVLDNGTYLKNKLAIGKNNITVKATTPGGVFLNDSSTITISANNVTFSGFQFTSGSIYGIVITVSGNYDTLTQLNFNGYSAQKYINLQGQYDVVSFCNFQNKPTSAPKGNLIHIAPNGSVPNYAKIRYCSFQKMPGAGGDNGNECIRIANGAQSLYVCRTIVEYCFFDSTGYGDSECISNKSRENVVRFNTFKNNQEAMLSFRNGDSAVAYSNFFINAGGIKVKEANSIYCYNNYFENSGATGSQGCIRYVYDTANTTHILRNINFIYNTFVNCGTSDLDKSSTSNTWANNIFKYSSGNIFTASQYAGISWAGNIYQGTLGISIPSGMANANPQLVLNSDGYYGLSSSSPAINAASASYPAILDIANIDDDPTLAYDIQGQSRPTTVTQKDVGCDEYTTGSTTNHPLSLSDVGPSYLGGPDPLPVEMTSFTASIQGVNNVLLQWRTATEVDNLGFEIERRGIQESEVSSQNSARWMKVGFVGGAGTSNSPKNYTFEDANLAPGVYIYRLRQIDVDGKFKYLVSTQVDAGVSKGFELLNNYPNPFNPETIICFSVPEDGFTTLKVFNMLGQEVAMLFSDVAKAGHYLPVTFNATGMSSGLYFARLDYAGQAQVRKLVLTK